MGGNILGRVCVVATIALASCAGDDPAPIPKDEDFERVTLSGVSFGHPAGWEPCRFPGNVIPGPIVEVRPDYWGGGTPPLSMQVVEDAGSYEENLELDTLALGPDAESSEEPVEVPGASEATLVEYSGSAFDFDFGGMSVYALGEDGTYVKVSWYSVPDEVEAAEPTFRAVVDTIDFDPKEAADTDLPECDSPAPP
jgi:hypothetical protein